MSTIDEAITYIFKWNALSDACPKCRRLNGREFYDQDINQGVLWGLGEGEIWNLDADHSMAHCKHSACNCRCQLAVRVECDWSKWEPLKELQQTLHNGGMPVDLTTEVYDLSPNISEARSQIQGFKQDVQQATPYVKELNQALTTYLALARRFGLPPEFMGLLVKAQQARIAVQTLTRSVQIFYATSGPLGWILAAGGLALGGLMVADMMEIRRPRY